MEKGRRNSVKCMYDPPFHAEAFLCVSSCLIFILVSLQKARGLLCGVIYHIIPYLRAADNAKLEGFVKKTAEDDGFLQNMILYLIKILLFCLFLTGNT